MKRLMTLEEFSECVRRGVKAGLPYELEKAKVNIKYGKEGHAQLQINRPESNTVIQYVLTFDYQEYLSGNITPESVIANILNNRNLYYVPADCYNLDIFNYNSVFNLFHLFKSFPISNSLSLSSLISAAITSAIASAVSMLVIIDTELSTAPRLILKLSLPTSLLF